MKIIAINGSPRRKGSTAKLIEECIKPLKEENEIKEYYLQNLELNPCIGCERCIKGLGCKFNGDAISKIIKEMLNADLVIFGSPIYFSQVTSQAKMLIDRFYSVFTNPEEEFTAKLVLFITHGFPDKTYEDYLEYTSKRTFELAGFKVIYGLTVGGLHDIGEIEKTREDALKKAYEIGEKIKRGEY